MQKNQSTSMIHHIQLMAVQNKNDAMDTKVTPSSRETKSYLQLRNSKSKEQLKYIKGTIMVE